MTGLTGTRRLIRLALRRDRVVLPAWILGLSFFMGATSALFVRDLGDKQRLVEETTMVATNAGMRLVGLTSGPTVGGYMLHRDYVTLAVLAAMMSTLAVVRHTRQNEELGRAELVGAAVVGRYAGLAAAVIVTLAADLVHVKRVPAGSGGSYGHTYTKYAFEPARHRFDDPRPRMAGVAAPQAGGAVEDFPAFGGPVVHAGGAGEQARLLLELAVGAERHPERFQMLGWRGGLGLVGVGEGGRIGSVRAWRRHGRRPAR